MDKFSLICELIITVAGVIPTIVSLVCLIKNIIQNKNWTLVMKMAMEAMTTVEAYALEHPEMTSDDKLAMALEAVKTACAAAGVDVNVDLIMRIKSYIEEMLKWSKTVNVEYVLPEASAVSVIEK